MQFLELAFLPFLQGGDELRTTAELIDSGGGGAVRRWRRLRFVRGPRWRWLARQEPLRRWSVLVDARAMLDWCAHLSQVLIEVGYDLPLATLEL
jgi:hypothetical protein